MTEQVEPWVVAARGLVIHLEFRLASQGGDCGLGEGHMAGKGLALRDVLAELQVLGPSSPELSA